jgi:glycosyltransferase involved in cell wall biosynthesis
MRDAGQPNAPSVVQKYHKPHIAVIVPYHDNYADYVFDALLSVQQQTYTHFSCVLVDDCSRKENFQAAERAISDLADERFQLIRAEENLGQIRAVFLGLDATVSDFVSVLDPDDRYAPTFLERMLAIHLNRRLFCPLVSCDQYFLDLRGGVVTGTSRSDGDGSLDPQTLETEEAMFAAFGFHRFVRPDQPGWHWTSTSSLMFRRAVLDLLRPTRATRFRNDFDSYFAQGAHMMGGSLFLREPLVYRGMHDHNDFLRSTIFSMYQRRGKDNCSLPFSLFQIDVVDAFLTNGGLEVFAADSVRALLLAQFRGPELAKLLEALPHVADMFSLTPEDAVPSD